MTIDRFEKAFTLWVKAPCRHESVGSFFDSGSKKMKTNRRSRCAGGVLSFTWSRTEVYPT